MKKFSLIAVAMAFMFSFAAPVYAQDKSLLGTLLGAGAGGFLGSKFGSGKGQLVFTALGTLVGAGFGRSVGQSLDRADQLSRPVYNQQPRYGRQIYGSRRTYSRQNISQPYGSRRRAVVYNRQQPRVNRICRSGVIREYQTVIMIDGQERPAYGRACYMADGSWRKM